MSLEVFTVVASIGALDNDILPLFKAPSDAHGGGITIIEAELCGSGTVTSQLLDTGTAGTGNSATIASFGAGTLAATIPQAMTISSTPFLDAGHYLGISETSGAYNSGNVSIKYVMGQ